MHASGWTAAALLAAVVAAGAAAAQPRIHYPEPPSGAVRVTAGVRFATSDSARLSMDVYRPAKSNALAPALIFYTPYWTADGRPPRETSDFVRSWARVAAAHGIVGIVPDIRAEPGTGNATTPTRALGDDFERLVAHLSEHASRYGVDRERLAVFAGSGGVWAALPAVEDPRQTAIRAAVMFYGGGELTALRPDLPLLVVRAGQDSPGIKASIDRLVALAFSQNAPLTVINYPAGHHGFEARDDNAITRQVIEQALEFVRRATSPEYQAALRAAGRREGAGTR